MNAHSEHKYEYLMLFLSKKEQAIEKYIENDYA